MESQPTTEACSYDELPFPCRPRPDTHPDHVAAVATLFGAKPPAAETCRVLEIGCGDGGNLIPMAAALPRASFVGVDLSLRQIAEGQERVAGLRLGNVALQHRDLCDLDPGFGIFDYIIAHGVYSWIPPAVQEKLLRICKENLAQSGIAYVSYNTYPGWCARGILRDYLLRNTSGADTPQERTRKARASLEALGARLAADRSVSPIEGAYRQLLLGAIEPVRKAPSGYLFHEYLEEWNEPLYFEQFVERAEAVGLAYVADANLKTMPHELAPALACDAEVAGPKWLAAEQLRDIAVNRGFRETLLGHADVVARRPVSPRGLKDLLVASELPVQAEVVTGRASARGAAVVRVPGPGLGVARPALGDTACAHLANIWPRNVGFDALLAEAGGREADAPRLAATLLRGAALGVIELRTLAFPGVAEVTECPQASPVSRLHAERKEAITNLRHASLELPEGLERRALALLDGTRDTKALALALECQEDRLAATLGELARLSLLVA
ncbi:methyltransferase regulatory domain-containing protein [Planctomycetota bacterium]